MSYDDHLAIYAAEGAALLPTAWERWETDLEALLGHSTDGDLAEDGYSLDTFYDMWEAGLAPLDAARTVPGYITREEASA